MIEPSDLLLPSDIFAPTPPPSSPSSYSSSLPSLPPSYPSSYSIHNPLTGKSTSPKPFPPPGSTPSSRLFQSSSSTSHHIPISSVNSNSNVNSFLPPPPSSSLDPRVTNNVHSRSMSHSSNNNNNPSAAAVDREGGRSSSRGPAQPPAPSAAENRSPWSSHHHVGTIGSGSPQAARAPAFTSQPSHHSSTSPNPHPRSSSRSNRPPSPTRQLSSSQLSSGPQKATSPQPQSSSQMSFPISPPSRPHSPPHAPPGTSRSRSQSLATAGLRPGFQGMTSFQSNNGGMPSLSGHGHDPWAGSNAAGGGGGGAVFDDDDDEDRSGGGGRRQQEEDDGFGGRRKAGDGAGGVPSSGVGDTDMSNMSPFTRDLQEILSETPVFQLPVPTSSNNPTHASRFDEFGFGRGSHSGYGFAENGGGILGFGLSSGEKGDRSGTGSRRHSVSIVGRRGADGRGTGGGAPGTMSNTSGGFAGSGNGYGSGRGGGFGGGGRGGFSDEDLATSLDNALNLNLDDEGGRNQSSSSYLDQHYHVPSSSAPYQHPSSLPIFGPSSPSSFTNFNHPSSFLPPSSLRPSIPFPERPQSKSRSASFGGEPIHGAWGSAFEDDDEIDELERRDRGRGRMENPSSVGSGRAERSISRGLPTLSSLGRGSPFSQHQQQQQSFSSGGPLPQGGGYYPYSSQPQPPLPRHDFRPPPPGPFGSLQGGGAYNPYSQGLPSPIGAPPHLHQQQQQAFPPPPSFDRMRGTSPFNPLGSRLPPPPQGGSPSSPFPTFYPQQQQPPQHHRHQSAGSPSSPPQGPSLTELGKGLPLSAVPTTTPLYIVEFKAGRTDLFYCPDPTQLLTTGDLVIVEADRGKDLGKIVNDSITLDEVKRFQEQQAELAFLAQQVGLGGQGGGGGASGGAGGGAGGQGGAGGAVGVVNSVTVRGLTKEIMPKRIYSKAMPLDAQLLLLKMQDEAKALALCQQKVKQKKLPMEVVDAEYQWDRRKLVFYFVASTRIDFRELVRELFRHFKTRIWMACLGGVSGGGPNEGGGPGPASQQQQQIQQ